MKHFYKIIYSVLTILIVTTLVHAESQQGKTDIETLCLDSFSPRKYYFGTYGEGLVKVNDNDLVLFDFGDKPNWFMLTYMHQYYEGDELVTRSEYYYPESGIGNASSNFTGYTVDLDDPDNPTYAIVTATYTFPELQGTTASLIFTIIKQTSSMEPISELWVSMTVDNKMTDTANDVWRLMEVHCPFVRMPPINETQADDVLVLGNNLLLNPIKNFANIAEPYAVANEVIRHGSRYPNGTQMSVYYEKSELLKSNGVYLSIVNLDHRTCEFNLWKRNKNNWDNWGYVTEENQPSTDKFIIWDVVHYPENVNASNNSHLTGNLIAHMRFARRMDWYDGAQFRRNELKWWDDIDSKQFDFFKLAKDGIESQWPDHTLKFDPLTPVDAKLNALMVYISPQGENNRHDLCPVQGDRPVINRIKEYERLFRSSLQIEDWSGIRNRLFAATWVGDYAEDTTMHGNYYKHREFYWNHPEWSTGGVPIDSQLRDPYGQSYMEMFYRDHLHDFITELSNTDNNIQTRFFCHNGPYNSHIENPERFNDPNHLSNEYFRVPFYENPDYPRLKNKLQNSVNYYNWGADCPQNSNLYGTGYCEADMPRIGWTNYEYYLGDYRVADTVYGSIFSVPSGSGEVDLAAGRTDSQFMSAPRWLGAGGIYAGVAVDYRPMYTNLRCFFNQKSDLKSAIDNFNFIPPGGNNLCYQVDKLKIQDMNVNYPDVITLIEGFKLPHLENVDIFRSEIWPPQLFESKTGPVSPVARQDFSRPIIDLQQQPPSNTDGFIDMPNLSFIPMESAIAHDYVVMMDGANTYIPYTFWHAYFKPAHYTSFGSINRQENLYWTYYGGFFGENVVPDVGERGFYRLEHAYEAYRADLAHSFTFGSRIMIFDVDRAVRESGEELLYDHDPDGYNYEITDLYTEKTAKSTRSFLQHLISRYKAWGWPTIEDIAADSLFFGQLLKTPSIDVVNTPPEFDRSLRYDLVSNLAIFDNEHANVTFHSPAVLTSLWKTNISDPNPSGKEQIKADTVLNDRLLFVLTNFTDSNEEIGGRSYTIKTEGVDLTQYLRNPEGYYYKFYYTPGIHTAVKPELISYPRNYNFNETVNGNSVVLVGILTTDHMIPSGIYARLDSDDNLDLILIDKKTGEISVIFGDGSHEYNPANAEFVMTGVKDFALSNSDNPDQAALVILTEKGLNLLKFDENSGFSSLLSADNVFSEASIIKTIPTDEELAKYIVLDGNTLHSVSIGSSKSGDQEFVIDEILSEPVRTFDIANLCGDTNQDIALISETGNVELISLENEIPESMIVIELNTSADTIRFEDTDLDTGLDIVLEENGTKNTEILEWVGGWKFAPSN